MNPNPRWLTAILVFAMTFVFGGMIYAITNDNDFSLTAIGAGIFCLWLILKWVRYIRAGRSESNDKPNPKDELRQKKQAEMERVAEYRRLKKALDDIQKRNQDS